VLKPFSSPLANTIPHAMINMMTVRIAVARFELTLAIPILAKIAVSEANNADNKAYIHHIVLDLRMREIIRSRPFNTHQFIIFISINGIYKKCSRFYRNSKI
jgi:hypothetical protein